MLYLLILSPVESYVKLELNSLENRNMEKKS